MLSPRWRKILRDLWINRVRTVLVILSIAAGVFAMGVLATSQIVLSKQLDEAYAAINPTSAYMVTLTPFDETVVEAVENMPEVAEVSGRNSIYSRLKTGPNEWLMMQINTLDDYENIKVDKIWPTEGK